MAEIIIVLLFSTKEKVTCCSSEAKIVGDRFILQRHQRLGKLLCLVFIAKSLRFRFTNHLLGKSTKSIQGSEIRTMSGYVEL
jgi:hypothetical protein